MISANAWIGLNDQASEGNFVWADADAATYRNWNASEPNDSGGEDCVEMQTTGVWNDLGCGDNSRSFVCEDATP